MLRCKSGAKAAIFGIIAFGLALAACSRTYDFSGHWQGAHADVSGADLAPSVLNSVRKVKLRIQDNTKFELENSSIPKSGSVSVSGQLAKLHVEHLMGSRVVPGSANAPPVITLRALSSDSIEMHDPAGVIRTPVLLRRVTQPPTESMRIR